MKNKSPQKNDSDFLESTKEISNIGKMILLENAIKTKNSLFLKAEQSYKNSIQRTKERNSKTSVRAMKLEQMLFNSQKWNSQIKRKHYILKNITD